ncbi:MAG: hypothetical protein KBS68_00730 [Clostridiales bacterium]|nr:hypothetical protein [Candidatus Crickella merdequi]
MRNPNRTASKRRREAKGDTSNKYDALVIYNSANGSTTEYAKMIAEALDCDIVPYSRKYIAYASLYRNVIFGTWIRAGELVNLQLLKKNSGNFDLGSKNLIIYGTGIAPVDDPSYQTFVKDRNSVSDMYFLPGKFDPKKVSKTAKASLGAMQETMYSQYSDTVENVMRERFKNGYDGISKDAIIPILEDVISTANE